MNTQHEPVIIKPISKVAKYQRNLIPANIPKAYALKSMFKNVADELCIRDGIVAFRDFLYLLCDSISLPHGAVLMEKKLVDVVRRHGLPEWTLRKWNEYFCLKRYFDDLTKCNIYTLLDNIVDNTFEWG